MEGFARAKYEQKNTKSVGGVFLKVQFTLISTEFFFLEDFL